jgi:hypothetical protein
MSSAQAFAALFKTVGLPDDILQFFRTAPFEVDSVDVFASTFSSEVEVKEKIQINTKLKENMGLQGKVVLAWLKAKEGLKRDLKREAEGLDFEEEEAPLRKEVAEALDKTFLQYYKYNLADINVGFPSMLGRFNRQFLKRNTLLQQVDKVRTRYNLINAPPKPKKQRTGSVTMTWDGDAEESAATDIKGLTYYMYGLKAVLMSMVLAGSFKCPADSEFLFCPMHVVMHYLGCLDTWIFRNFEDGVDERTILRQLRIVDETIRTEWASFIRANVPVGCTFDDAYKATKSEQTAMLSIQLGDKGRTGGAYQASDKGVTKGQIKKQLKDLGLLNRTGAPKGGGKGNFGVPLNAFAPGGKGNQGGRGKGNQGGKQGKLDRKGEKLCRNFNSGQQCRPDCYFKHACSAINKAGGVCGGSHRQTEHKY